MKYVSAFLRSPLKVGFVVLLTALLLPFSVGPAPVQAAEFSSGYSCVLINSDGAGLIELGDDLVIRCNYGSTSNSLDLIATGSTANGAGNPVDMGSREIRYALTATDYTNAYGTSNLVVDRSCGTDCFEARFTINDIPANPQVYLCSADSTVTCNSSGVATSQTFNAWWTPTTAGTMRNVRSSMDPNAIPTDTFTGADNWEPIVTNRCENVTIGVEYENAALTVADYDDTLYSANGSAERDKFVFVALFEDWNFETEPSGMLLSYRWPGNAAWSPVFDIIDTVTFNSGADSGWTFRLGTSTARFLSQVQWRCIDTTAPGGETVQSRYLPFWDPGPSVNDPNWQESAEWLSPCYGITIYPQSGSVAPGAVGRVSYLLSSASGLTDLDVFAYGVSGFMPTAGAAQVGSTSALGVVTGGPPPLAWQVAPGSGFLTFTLPSAVAEPVAYSDLVYSCSDSVQSGLIIAGSADLGLTGTLDEEQQGRLSGCFKFESMKLTSPASWVTGVGQMFTCLFRELTIPDADVLIGHVEDFNMNVGEKPPWVVFTTLIVFADDVNDAFQASSGTGCFDAGGVVGITADSDICAGEGLNVEPSQRTTMAILFTAPMLLGLAGHMLGLIRGEPDFITEPNGQMRMNF